MLEKDFDTIFLHRGVRTSSSKLRMGTRLRLLWQLHAMEHYFEGGSEPRTKP